MYRKIVLAASFIVCTCFSATAADNLESAIDRARKDGAAVKTITPIYSQLLMFSFPPGFVGVFEKASPGGQYVQEFVLKGETANQWSQMVTVTGAKGLSANANVTPQLFLGQIASGFKRACPDTFTAKGIGALKISGFDAYIALAGCGAVLPANDHSETALLIAIKGENDYYTIQWAERGPAAGQPIELNDEKWQNRSKALFPIKLCPVVAGEAAPYPSCANQH